MAIDSVRLLTDSAGQLWLRLSDYGTIEALTASDCFDDWIAGARHAPAPSPIEEQTLRRDYRRLRTLLTEIEALVHSRSRALDLVRARAAEDPPLD